MSSAAQTIAGADLNQLSINPIRTLSIDAVKRAKSGHPGAPMAIRLSTLMELGAVAKGLLGKG
jgi:hypothetical protein